MSVLFLGQVHHRGSGRQFGIREADRLMHVYVIGETGVGKTKLIESLVLQDIAAARGCMFIDPHGDAVRSIEAQISPERRDALVSIDISDPSLAVGYNPLAHVSEGYRPLVASGLMSVMKKMWPDAWGVRMEHILRNTLLALLDQPSAQLPDLVSMLTHKQFRADAVARIQNVQVKQFWTVEFPAYAQRASSDAFQPILNKIGAFLSDPRLRRFVCPSDRGLRFRELMDEGRTVLVNLSKGVLGEDSSAILGGMLVSAVGLAGLSRANIATERRRPFFLYLDEFQNVTTLAIAEMLSELRKYGVGLVMAHQYMAQLEPQIRSAVLGNVGTLVSFRVGVEDARLLARQFEPAFQPLDLLNLPNRHMSLRLMIDGEPSQPFSATTISVPKSLT